MEPGVDPDDEPNEHLLEDAELFEVEIERFALSRDWLWYGREAAIRPPADVQCGWDN